MKSESTDQFSASWLLAPPVRPYSFHIKSEPLWLGSICLYPGGAVHGPTGVRRGKNSIMPRRFVWSRDDGCFFVSPRTLEAFPSAVIMGCRSVSSDETCTGLPIHLPLVMVGSPGAMLAIGVSVAGRPIRSSSSAILPAPSTRLLFCDCSIRLLSPSEALVSLLLRISF